MTPSERMTALCRSFPLLEGADGVEPWDQLEFARWASMPRSGAVQQSAAFVLAVFNGGTPENGGWWDSGVYSVGRFDPVKALNFWDAENRKAYLAWCQKPWWP